MAGDNASAFTDGMPAVYRMTENGEGDIASKTLADASITRWLARSDLRRCVP